MKKEIKTPSNIVEFMAMEIIYGCDRLDKEDLNNWIKEEELVLEEVKLEVGNMIREKYPEECWSEGFLTNQLDFWFSEGEGFSEVEIAQMDLASQLVINYLKDTRSNGEVDCRDIMNDEYDNHARKFVTGILKVIEKTPEEFIYYLGTLTTRDNGPELGPEEIDQYSDWERYQMNFLASDITELFNLN